MGCQSHYDKVDLSPTTSKVLNAPEILMASTTHIIDSSTHHLQLTKILLNHLLLGKELDKIVGNSPANYNGSRDSSCSWSKSQIRLRINKTLYLIQSIQTSGLLPFIGFPIEYCCESIRLGFV